MFNLSYFPEAWSEGLIVPLHKKGDLDDTANYRGITLLSTIGKLFSKIINNRLSVWGDKYNVYIEAQAGFRKGMGTVDNIFVLQGIISHILNQNKKRYTAFIDFTKAFDFDVRDIIWYKLIKLGIRGKILNIVRSMYNVVKSKIKYNNEISHESFTCFLGVRQGESLSPFLFSMYLNDIEEHFMLNKFEGVDLGMLKLFLLLYADDIVLFAESEVGLQNGLDLLDEYCAKWKLCVNINKTKIMIFKKGGQNRKHLKFTYQVNELEIVNKFTYLGVIFTKGASFSATYDSFSGQALKALFKLKSNLVKFTNISVSHSLELFDKLIEPILNYGCEVWGLNNSIQIERIHLRYCKQVLGVRTQTQNNFIYGELGR